VITFKSEYQCNVEWAENPTHVEVYLGDEWLERIPAIATRLKEMGVHSGNIHYAAGYQLFTEDEDAEDYPATLAVFEPEYRIGGSTLRIYDDATFIVLFSLKHTSEEGFTNNLTILDGVRS